MKRQPISKARFLKPTMPSGENPAERVKTVHLQELFSGPVPLRNERPAAVVLTEVKAGSAIALFIP